MITAKYDKEQATYFALSTDTKPTANVSNGTCCLELDTGKIYFFSADDGDWLEWGAGA